VTITLLPTTIGLDIPRPKSSAFQAMFSPVSTSHCIGGDSFGAPLVLSPRKRSQSAPGIAHNTKATQSNLMRITF
jgi:hypothetical protein